MGVFTEMNVHMPQSVQTMCELMDFASVPYHIITPKDGEPIMEIIQDTMTGAFRLTKDYVRMSDKVFANLQMVNSYFDGHLPEPIDKKHFQYNGFQAFSHILPPGFYLDTKNEQEVKIRDIDETGKEIVRKDKEKVIIKNSKLVSGTLDKWTFNSMSRGIIPVIFHDYGPFELQRFLDNTQRLICRWLVTAGFSVGISDLVTDENTGKAMKDAVGAMKTKAYKIIEDARRGKLDNKTIFTNAENFERMLINVLNEASSETGSIGLKEINDKTNRMINMVKSGAKGKKSNVAQMIALVGQQNIEGKRVGYGFTDRTLPHFTKYDDGPEARGFVENSFISGLTPQEVFFHAMSGREGLIDTAVKTSETGYIQRRLVKAMEDCKVYYDQTVRNAGGSVVQFLYGEDGMEGTKVEKQYIPTIDLDMIELDTKYHLRPEDALNIHMHPEAFKRLSGDRAWAKRCSEHFQQIVEDREYLIHEIFQGEKMNMIIYPIAFDRILKNARESIKDAGLEGVPSDLTPGEILDEIDRLIKKLYVNVPHQGTRFLEILLRIHLSPKPMIMRYHMTSDMFKWVVQEIERRYYEAIAPAGEMVGIIAAQSLGEPLCEGLKSNLPRKLRITLDKPVSGSYTNTTVASSPFL
jgi:DNA-directed RNA polymerase II subunit RPB1